MRLLFILDPRGNGTRVTVEEAGYEGLRVPLRKTLPFFELAARISREDCRRAMIDEGTAWKISLRKLLRVARAHWKTTMRNLKTYCETIPYNSASV